MKKVLNKLISYLGYIVINKKKIILQKKTILQKYNVSENTELFVRSEKFIKELEAYFPKIRFTAHRDGFIAFLNDLQFYIESTEEFFILKEIFVETDYNYITQQESIVIDIGTNVGIAALFFSQFSFIEKIYCFEPVPDTYAQAKYNFSLNSQAHKIEVFKNIGLGNIERNETFLYNKEVKGNTGIRGNLSPSYKQTKNVAEIDVIIKNASNELLPIIQANLSRKVILKVDCEGSEYEIFETLNETKLLQKFDVVMMEWHDRGPKELLEILSANGFQSFSKNLSPISGIIYAYR